MMWIAAVTNNPVVALVPALFIAAIVGIAICGAIFED
jgi:hypothetical protein